MHTRRKQLWTMMAAIALAGGGLAMTAGVGASGGTAVTGTTTLDRTAASSGATATSATLGGSSVVATDAPTSTLSPGQVQVANKVSGPFVTMAGSQENAVALATALRTGTTANLIFTSTSPTGETTQTAIELAIPTKPMGWGNVSHSLALAQLSLRQAGIDNPTATDLQSALNGGTVTAADGKSVTLAGVLQQRAGGMGWGQIAKSYGTTMGAVNRGLKAPATTVASSASPPGGPTSAAKRTVATGAADGNGARGVKTTSGLNTNIGVPGHGSKGITTATGAVSNNSASAHSAKGIVTASGAAGGSSGVVTAGGHGQGNAIGRGVVTAGGGGGPNSAVGARGGASGVVTGSGASAMAVTTAQSGGGAGNGNGHGKGKGGS